ncbi:hypothetical protein O3P69_018113 [Scylla paramamosain]|uniref:Reverse transcriptase domain-containing protein n=1 Tax=Scylla paramamosain TaxID=85552 RepID=A0AAW0TIU3_SCYPA
MRLRRSPPPLHHTPKHSADHRRGINRPEVPTLQSLLPAHPSVTAPAGHNTVCLRMTGSTSLMDRRRRRLSQSYASRPHKPNSVRVRVPSIRARRTFFEVVGVVGTEKNAGSLAAYMRPPAAVNLPPTASELAHSSPTCHLQPSISHLTSYPRAPVYYVPPPYGSVLGSLLWCVYFNDILELVPEAQAYADNYALTFTCDRNHHQDTYDRINIVMQSIATWGRRWQLTFAPEKSQGLHISMRREGAHPQPPSLKAAHCLSSSPSPLSMLDRIQARAQRMVHLRDQNQQHSFQPLQQRRDVAGLCVMYKALRQQTPHLAPLRLPSPPIPTHDTRTAGQSDHHLTIAVHFARTESSLRFF